MAEIVVDFKANTSDFQSAVQRSIAEVQQLGKQGNATATEMSAAYNKIGQDIAKSMGKGGVDTLAKECAIAQKEAERLGKELRQAVDAKPGEQSAQSIADLRKRFQEANKEAMAFEQVLQGAQQELANIQQQQQQSASQGMSGFFEGISQKVQEATSGMANVKSAIDLLPQPLQNVASKASGLMQSFKLMTKIPLLAVISLLVSAFQSLNEFMHSTTETGAKGLKDLQGKASKLNSIVSAFKTVMVALQNIGYKVGEALYHAFDDPIQSCKNLVKWIKDKIVVQLDALGQCALGVGQMLKGAFTFDTDKITEGWEALKNGVKKGFDNSLIGDFAKEINNAAASVGDLADKLKDIEDRKIKLQIEKINWKPIEAGLDEKIRSTQTKIYEETDDVKKAQAIEEAQKLIAEKYEQRVKFAREELALQQKQMAITPSTIEDFEKEAELKANLIQLEAERLQEGMRLTRMYASIQKTAHQKEIANLRELEKLYMTLDKEKLESQKESIDKSIALIDQESKEKRLALENQIAEWKKANKDASLTEAQEAYVIAQSEWIDEEAARKKQEALIKTYETTANKFRELAQKYSKDINSLQDEGSKNVATDQINKDALSLVQNDPELRASFQAWTNTLSDMTLAELRGQIQAAEEALKQVDDQTGDKAMMLRATIQAAKDAAEKTETALMSKKPSASIKDLNSQLRSCGQNLKTLGEDTEGAMGDVASAIGDAIELTSTLIDSWQTLRENFQKLSDLMAVTAVDTAEKIGDGTKKTADSIVNTERSAVAAIKAIETASVILAIVGAIVQAAQAIVKLVNATSAMEKVRADAKQVNKEIEKMLIELDLANNKLENIAGQNVWGSFIESTKSAQTYLESLNGSMDKVINRNLLAVHWQAAAGYTANMSEYFGEAYDNLSMFEKALTSIEQMDVKVKHKTWFSSPEWKKLGELYNVRQYNEEGNLDEKATIESLKKIKESDYWNKIPEEQRDMIDNMITQWDAYEEAVEQSTEALKDWFGSITDAFGDAMVNAFETGEDAAMSFKTTVGDSIRSMVKDMLISQYITKYFDEAAEKITEKETSAEWKQMTDNERANYIADTMMEASDAALGNLEMISEAYAQASDRLSERGYLSSTEADANTLSGAIAGASQESIDLLSGYCNAVRIQQVESIDIMRQQLITMSGVEANTAAISSSCNRILNYLEGQTTDGESLRASGL